VATSVHIPPRLLKALDKRAETLGVSRNSLIVKAIEHELGEAGDRWPAGFFEAFAAIDDEARAELTKSMAVVKARRSSKPPVRF